ncbi:diguanylate cyclase [Vibrio alfacsensis]|uniref:sensor domain-containing diguanylate cyclase n=1 Tax=Vibrio alfacsensis TaxID=1074311 RepID=UPI002ADE2EB9|nr:diguanylate cyclase [Vibrio alfacsensis]WQE78883.1 diguanylate cyclase [Vibrio alfacsensis]
MAFPRFLIRYTRPYLLLLGGFILYSSYEQIGDSEAVVYRQSQTNIITAKRLVKSQVEAAYAKLFLLEAALKSSNENPNTKAFTEVSDSIVEFSPQYSAVLYSTDNQEKAYFPDGGIALQDTSKLHWHKLNTISERFYLSSLYQNTDKRWVFALKYVDPSVSTHLWLEFDLLHTTQQLRDLKTLNDGYIFVVDRDTGRLVFHPDPSRVGDTSVSYHGGISDKVTNGQQVGKHEYYYQGDYKVSVFDAENRMHWVYVSGTDRADIINNNYPLGLIAALIMSLLALSSGVHYLTDQLHRSLSRLNNVTNVGEFRDQIKRILNRFCYHNGIQLCLYDGMNHGIYTLDYHGNRRLALVDKSYPSRFDPSNPAKSQVLSQDDLVQKLKISRKNYSMPLFDGSDLMAVLYISYQTPPNKYVLNLIQSYAQTTLVNLRLRERLRHQDPVTQLENKTGLATHIARELGENERFVATVDIDNFSRINEIYGYPVGDLIIKQTANVLRDSFPKPMGICVARTGGDEFTLLFKAGSLSEAQKQLEHFKDELKNDWISMGDGNIKFTVSIGVTGLENNYHHTVAQIDKAMMQAKRLGKNRVCCAE